MRERFAAIYTAALADILDARGYREQTVAPSIRPLAPGTRLAGPAYTVAGRPAEPASYDEALRKVLRMLEEVPEVTSPSTRASRASPLTSASFPSRR